MGKEYKGGYPIQPPNKLGGLLGVSYKEEEHKEEVEVKSENGN